MKFAFLSMLSEHPRSVGKLKTDFENRTRNTWPINIGQVYQTIKRLTRDGLGRLTPVEYETMMKTPAITAA